MPRVSWILLAVILSGLAPAATPLARAAEADVRPAKPVCLPPAETREEIKAHRLIEPFAALKSAQAQFKAEPLSARLCRAGEEYIYEIALLHQNGRYVHVVMNATTGKFIETRRPKEKETASKP